MSAAAFELFAEEMKPVARALSHMISSPSWREMFRQMRLDEFERPLPLAFDGQGYARRQRSRRGNR